MTDVAGGGVAALYAVAGNPVAHSRSPTIHAAFARQTGQSMRYERWLCPDDAFEATLRRQASDGASGCNVTLPFKFAAFALAAQPTPRARLAGACNTLRFDADGWAGDNTDGVGLVTDLQQRTGIELAGRRVLVIGAGGAAAGVLGALLACGAAGVTIANRTLDKACSLAASHAEAAARHGLTLQAASLDECGEGYDLVVNASATSVVGAPVPVHARVLARGAHAVDLMYGAPARPFVAWAEAHGASGQDGLGMLVEQAAESFFFWRGVTPRTDEIYSMLRAEIDA